MSKKSKKRQSRKRSSSRASNVQMETVAEKGSGASYDGKFNLDYIQTIMDLKRIGILASSFFVILIILAFFLR